VLTPCYGRCWSKSSARCAAEYRPRAVPGDGAQSSSCSSSSGSP
jgi:hypothetical protein